MATVDFLEMVGCVGPLDNSMEVESPETMGSVDAPNVPVAVSPPDSPLEGVPCPPDAVVPVDCPGMWITLDLEETSTELGSVSVPVVLICSGVVRIDCPGVLGNVDFLKE